MSPVLLGNMCKLRTARKESPTLIHYVSCSQTFLFDTEFSAYSHEVTLKKKRKMPFGGGGLIIAQEASAP